MTNNKKIKLLLSTGLLAVTAANVANASGVESIISDQRSRQIARQISGNITDRIVSDVDPTLGGSNTQNPNGASADRKSFLPDSLWSSFSWSRISNDSASDGLFDVDIYQTTTGIDKNIGDFYFGTTLTYAGTVSDIYPPASMQGSTHSVGLTPYIAYVINKNFFLSAMSGYNYSNNNFKSPTFAIPESESDAYQTEIDLNGLHVIDQWFMKGKIGARYLHVHNKTDPFLAGGSVTRDNLDSWTYLVDTEGGYVFKNGLRLSTGILYEYNNPKPNLGTADGVFYYSAGADYSVNKKLNLGAKVQTDLSNQDIDLTTVSLTARLALD